MPRRASHGTSARLRALLALLLALTACGAASAHGTTIPHALAGVDLCVDDASLAVSFSRDGSGVAASIVAERLERALRRTFDAAAVSWRRRARCRGDGYVEVALHVRDAPWFAPRAVAYDAVVRVGPRREERGRVVALPPEAFDFSVGEIYDEAAVGTPAFVFLPRYVEAALRDLTVSWWEDREAPPPAPGWLPWLGGGIAGGVVAGGALWARRRRR